MMEIADWNHGSVILLGLDTSMKPSMAREAAERGIVVPMPDGRVVSQLKTMATYLYNHQKMTPIYQANITDGKNTLAYFLCAQYEMPARKPSDSKKRSKSPKLRSCVTKPLGFWDSVYYAEVAAVRYLYYDLQQRFGADFGGGTTPIILHNAGANGADASGHQPWSALQMAAQLEEMWFALTDERLVSALDKAVRLRHVEEQIGELKDFDTEEDRIKASALFEKAEGVVNVNALSPDQITRMLWNRHATSSRKMLGESFESESLLSACRAEVREAGILANQSGLTHTMRAHCVCDGACACRDFCDIQANECACAFSRNQTRDVVEGQHAMHSQILDQHYRSEILPNPLFGAVTNHVAQMQVAAMATTDPYIVQAIHATSDAADRLDTRVLQQQRRMRSNTKDSDLAYVPGPITPSRARKDNYPLNFYGAYGSDSPQRYPKLRQASAQNQSSPEYDTCSSTSKVPARKPVPMGRISSRSPAHAQMSMQGLTPPNSSPFDVAIFAQAGQVSYPHIPASWQADQVTYPTIPVSQSDGKFDQSFTSSASSTKTCTEKLIDDTVPATDYSDLADEAQSIVNPFTDEAALPHIHSKQPTTRSASVSTNRPSPTRNTSINLSKPHPPLPQPDFIAPRPALKQRYVSAGGRAKLCEREEIPGPAIVHQSTGAAMHKDELFSKLNDPEFIKQNFGEDAAKMSVDLKRTSEGESGANLAAGSQRGSGESLTRLMTERKRERAQSGESSASGSFGRLKRVFSRKNSDSE